MQETTLSKDDERITRIVVKEETPSLRYGFEPKDEDSVAFFELCSTIRQCGEAARPHFRRMRGCGRGVPKQVK